MDPPSIFAERVSAALAKVGRNGVARKAQAGHVLRLPRLQETARRARGSGSCARSTSSCQRRSRMRAEAQQRRRTQKGQAELFAAPVMHRANYYLAPKTRAALRNTVGSSDGGAPRLLPTVSHTVSLGRGF